MIILTNRMNSKIIDSLTMFIDSIKMQIEGFNTDEKINEKRESDILIQKYKDKREELTKIREQEKNILIARLNTRNLDEMNKMDIEYLKSGVSGKKIRLEEYLDDLYRQAYELKDEDETERFINEVIAIESSMVL